MTQTLFALVGVAAWFIFLTAGLLVARSLR
jgi:hypothetical protein